MKKLILYFICFLFIPSFLSAQDTEKLIKYYEVLGQSSDSLAIKWGKPEKEEITDYGKLYKFKEEKADFEFYLDENKVIAASMKLQPGNDDESSFTFYVVIGFQLEKEGFERIETSYDPENISMDGRTHNFVKEYDISDKFKKDNIIVNMKLTRSENKRLTFESFSILSNKQQLFQSELQKLERSKDFYKRIASNFDLLLKDWGKPDKRDFNGYDKSDIVTYYENNFWGNYAFLSIDNKIFKIVYAFQGSDDNKSRKLFDNFSKTYEEAGYKSEIIPLDGFNVKSLKFSKDNITITHNLFPMPKEGKYPNEEVLTIETTITK